MTIPSVESLRWQSILEKEIAYSTIVEGGQCWTVFRLGPAKVGYPNFPVGLDENDSSLLENPDPVYSALRSKGVDLLRLSAPTVLLPGGRPVKAFVELPETRIADLESWKVEMLSASVRRKLRKASAAGLEMVLVEAGDGKLIYELYRRTITRHNGHFRYTRDYFEALCNISVIDNSLLVAKAMAGERVAGFIVVRHNEGASYYLHGGYDDAFASIRPGYFAMAWALKYSRDRGSKRFEFLTSPAAQPALREYKESFGGESRLRTHWDEPLTWLGKLIAGVLLVRQAAATIAPYKFRR